MSRARSQANKQPSRRAITPEASELVARWRPSLEPFLATLTRSEQQEHATRYLAGLLSSLPHKTTETIAYFFNQPRHGLQHFLGASAWDWSGQLIELASQADAALAEADGVATLHLIGFPKRGNASVGVERQATSPSTAAETCQIAIYLGYASRKGAAVVDTCLYLPPSWIRDRARRQRCGVPPRLGYRRFGRLAAELLGRLGSRLAHAWVVADSALGCLPEVRQALRGLGKTYLVAVPATTPVRPVEDDRPRRTFLPAHELGASLSGKAWAPTLAVHRVPEIATIPVVTQVTHRAQQRETLVAISPSELSGPQTEYYLSNASGELPPEEWCRAAASLARTADYLRRARSEVGLASYEVRTWAGWHHHQALALVAAWLLSRE